MASLKSKCIDASLDFFHCFVQWHVQSDDVPLALVVAVSNLLSGNSPRWHVLTTNSSGAFFGFRVLFCLSRASFFGARPVSI